MDIWFGGICGIILGFWGMVFWGNGMGFLGIGFWGREVGGSWLGLDWNWGWLLYVF